MIFHKTHEQVLAGTKTQTRRLVKEGDTLINWPMPCVFRNMKNGEPRLKFRANQIYAVQPGRGKKGVGFIGITNIRRERLQDISIIDCYAEGTDGVFWDDDSYYVHIRERFGKMWDGIHPQGKRWKDNPEVWVLEFELCEHHD